MTIVRISDLDERRGMDPNSVPRHNGADRGCMEAQIRAGTDMRTQEAGYGKRGAPVYESTELGDPMFYGSATVISVNDQPPLPPEMAPTKTRTPEELLAMMVLGQKK